MPARNRQLDNVIDKVVNNYEVFTIHTVFDNIPEDMEIPSERTISYKLWQRKDLSHKRPKRYGSYIYSKVN